MIDPNSTTKGRFSHAIEEAYTGIFSRIKAQLRDAIIKLVAKNLLKRVALIALGSIPVVGTLLSVILNIVSSANLVLKLKKLYNKLVNFVKGVIKSTIKFIAKHLLSISRSLLSNIFRSDVKLIKDELINEASLKDAEVSHDQILSNISNLKELVSAGLPLPLHAVIKLQLDMYRIGIDYNHTVSSLYYEALKSKHNLVASKLNADKRIMAILGLMLGSIGTALASKFGITDDLASGLDIIKIKLEGRSSNDPKYKEIVYHGDKSWYRTRSAITDYKFTDTGDQSSKERQSINRYYGKNSEFTRGHKITSGYGHRKRQAGSSNSSGYHWGIDYSAPKGTPVLAPMDGYLFYHGSLTSGAGRYATIISDSGKNVARFLHLSSANEDLGDIPELRGSLGKLYGTSAYNTVVDSYNWAVSPVSASVHVNAGDVIGYSGASGTTEDSYSPHLHAEFGSVVKMADGNETLVLITPDSQLVNDVNDTIDEATLVSNNDISVNIIEI